VVKFSGSARYVVVVVVVEDLCMCVFLQLFGDGLQL